MQTKQAVTLNSGIAKISNRDNDRAGNDGHTMLGAEEALGWYQPGGGGAARIRPGGNASGGEWRGSAEVVQTRGDGCAVAVGTRWGWRLLDPWHRTAVVRGRLQVVASSIWSSTSPPFAA